MSWLRGLRELGPEDAGLAGGKAVSLGRMAAAGLPVPGGFVVTTEAFDEARRGAGAAAACLDEDPPDELVDLSEFAARRREVVAQLPLPAGLEDQVAAAVGDLPGPLAVRSSATAEDLPDASFAGQHASFLGAHSAAEVVQLVRSCWASLWTPRAVAYRRRVGVPAALVKPAVIVQQVVDAEVAGVLFTVDPRSGDPEVAVLTLAWGLGEGVVSGEVDPDTYRLDVATGRVLEARVGAKARAAALGPDGRETRWRDVDPGQARRACVDADRARRLLALAREAEGVLGPGLDVELALVGDRDWLVQARPVTTGLPRLPRLAEGGCSDTYIWSHANVAETMPDPPSALGWSLLMLLLSELLALRHVRAWMRPDIEFFHMIRGRPFWNLTPLFWWPAFGREVTRRWVRTADSFTAEVMEQLFDRGDVRPVWPHGVAATLGLGWLALVRVPLELIQAAWTLRRPQESAAALDRAFESSMAALRRPPAPGTDPAQRILDLLAGMRGAGSWMRRLHRLFVGGMFSFMRLALALERWFGFEDHRQRAFRLAPSDRPNFTEQISHHLWALSRRVRADPVAADLFQRVAPPEAFRQLLDDPRPEGAPAAARAFLAAWGHRGSAEQLIARPRWGDDPAPVGAMLAAFLRLEDDADPGRRRAEEVRTRNQEFADLLEQLRSQGRWGRLRARRLVQLRTRAQALFRFREDAKHYAFQLFHEIRRRVLEVGAELAADDRLARAEDVFDLSLEELEAWAQRGFPRDQALRGTVLRRRLDRLRHARTSPPQVVSSRGEEWHLPTPGAAGPVIRGEAASPGRVEGRARVLRDPSEAGRLSPGEVLVAPFTDPSWTPLFVVAAALVMDVGGVISHGVVTAREFGIPAVVGVGRASDAIEDGAWVRVDGSAGTVEVLAGPGEEPPSD